MNNINIKVSIIIPVYNMEQYLRQCLDSIVNQTLKEIEIICINDCSTDDSLNILKEYAAKDRRFVIIEQEYNQGQGAARNLGIELAKGEYIGFVDPDDWLDTTMYEKLYNQAKNLNSEIVMCEFTRYNENTGDYTPSQYIRTINENFEVQFPKLPENTNLNKHCINSLLLVALHYSWNRIYKKDFINKFSIRYSNHRCFQDISFVFQAMLYAEKISYIEEILYFYRVHLLSNIRSRNNKANIYIEICEHIKNILIKNNLFKKLKHNYDYFAVRGARMAWKNSSEETRNNISNKIKKFISRKAKIKLKENLFKAHSPKISLIIPIYNSAKFLEQCYKNIQNQTFGDLQIILINNCSTDNSAEIINKYLGDKRIKLINFEEHRTLGHVRNKGVEKAKADYVMFLSPEDWLENNACETAYYQILQNENDFVMFGFNEYDEKNNTIKPNTYHSSAFKAVTENSKIDITRNKNIWKVPIVETNIYNKNFLLENEITFTKNNLKEDVPLYAQLFAKTTNFSTIDKTLYNKKIETFVNYSDEKSIEKFIYMRTKALDIIKKSDNYKDIIDTYLIYTVSSYINWFEKFSKEDKELHKTIFKKIRNIFVQYSEKYDISKIRKYIPYNKYRNIVKHNYTFYMLFNRINIFQKKNDDFYYNF